MRFAERVGIIKPKNIQIECMDDALKNRLWNYIEQDIIHDEKLRKHIIDKFGIKTGSFSTDYDRLFDLFVPDSEWYEPYEAIEYYVGYYKLKRKIFIDDLNYIYKSINDILIEEKSGYRMIDGEFVKITDEAELEEIQAAVHSPFSSVDTHIKKALALYSDRKQPDYENSIKESISAVEAMCCIITGSTGGQGTLGAALKKLEDNGVEIHGAMRSAFSQLYGYTSDQNGIRHGGIDFTNAPEEDARYMLVTCSAFVNYLKDKYSKAQSGGTT